MRFEATETLRKLVAMLIDEDGRHRDVKIPHDEAALFELYRALVNVRPPFPASDEYLTLEDAYLQAAIARSGVTNCKSFDRPLALWRGDITALRADAIVNAANDQLLGCFVPGHTCIDNAIHTFAGVRLRLACNAIMQAQGHPEPTGGAKITPAFNLPSRYVIHTVGPIVKSTEPTANDCELLASCYRSCLQLAEAQGLSSVAFCCISTGVFRFPKQHAAEIAVNTVNEHLASNASQIQVIFNVFTEADQAIYQRALAISG